MRFGQAVQEMLPQQIQFFAKVNIAMPNAHSENRLVWREVIRGMKIRHGCGFSIRRERVPVDIHNHDFLSGYEHSKSLTSFSGC